MKRLRDISSARATMKALFRQNLLVGCVPTMGALHKGHLSLLKAARAAGAQRVVASIFVNPTQFDRQEDLSKYPRNLEEDLLQLEAAGCDAVFFPSEELMYPSGFQTEIRLTEVASGLCGEHRPGHFVGVATVVMKLLNILRPSLLVLGEKDFQQLAVIRRLVTDLNVDTQVVGAPLVRDSDGLALSSRNARLSAEERVQAQALYRGLMAARQRFEAGTREAKALIDAAARVFLSAGIEPEYLELRRSRDLAPLQMVNEPCRLLVAAYVGSVRLIDNVVIADEHP